MKLSESIKVIGKVVLEYKEAGVAREVFKQEEMIIGERYFLVTGEASANMIDDSDFDRETGYGRLVYPEDLNVEITSIMEILDDDTSVDVTNDPGTRSLVIDHIKEEFESQH
jgi:hypothetical protein